MATLLMAGCGEKKKDVRKMLREEVIEYNASYGEYQREGIYKKIIRTYNYPYKKVVTYWNYVDRFHCERVHINEYGDTVKIEYIDTSNYPRRED